MRSKHFVTLTVVAVLASAAVGCDKDPVGPRSNSSTPPVQSGIRVALAEKLPGRELQLLTRTDVEYPCCNYGIATSVDRSTAEISIDFSSIEIPDICLTSTGPATTEVNLGALAPGRYPLRIRGIAGDASLQIQVQSGSYAIVGPPDPRIHFEETILNRIPDGVVWGYFNYVKPENEPAIRTALSEMRALGATDVSLAPGTYHANLPSYGDRFEVLSSGLLLRPHGGVPFQRSFTFRYSGDRDALRDLVARFDAHTSEGIWLTVLSTTGDVFLSWYTPS